MAIYQHWQVYDWLGVVRCRPVKKHSRLDWTEFGFTPVDFACNFLTVVDNANVATLAGQNSTVALGSNLYTDGSTAFWDYTGANLITSSSLPPAAASKQSRVILRTPAGDYTSTTTAPVVIPFSSVPVTHIQAFLKTPSIHHDVACRVEIAFVFRPAISIKYATIDNVQLHTVDSYEYCSVGSLDKATGFGTCILIDFNCNRLFPAGAVDQTLAITLSATNVVSQPMAILVAAQLAPNATSSSHSNRGTAYVTRVPTTPGAAFPMRVTANTLVSLQPTAYAFLYTWELKIVYNPTVLNPSASRVSLSSVYGSLSTNVQVVSATEHVITVLAVVNRGSEASSAGAQVEVCTVNFIVSPSVVVNTVVRGIQSALFTSMINEGNNVFTGTSAGIMINDMTPLSLTNTADIRVTPNVGLIGIRVYTANAHLVLKPDGGAREAASVTVMGVQSGYGVADTAITDPVSCVEQPITAPSRLTVSSTCLQILPLALPTPRAPVGVTFGGFSTIVDFRVHVASIVRLVAVRGTLAGLCLGSTPPLYQSTRIKKMVQFDDGGGVKPPEVDVTMTDYDFTVTVSGAASAVRWDNKYGAVTALAAGTVTFTPQATALGRTITPVSITIVNTAVPFFSGISLFSFNSVTWLKSGLVPIFQDVASFTGEGQGHTIVAVTVPDGDFISAPPLVSSVPTVYALTLSGPAASRYYTGVIPVGAYGAGYSGSVIVTGSVGGCQVNAKSVNVTLPVAISANITLGLNKATGFIVGVTGDKATEVDGAVSPLISVTVLMSDGSKVEAGGDARTSLLNTGGMTVTKSATTAVLSQVTGTQRVFQLRATVFDGMLTTSNSLSVTISVASALSLVARKTYGGTVAATSLLRISCNPNLYEAVAITTTLTTTAGTSLIVTPLLTLDTPATLRMLTDGRTFRGVNTGSSNLLGIVSAAYGSLVASITLTVSTAGVDLTAGTLSAGANPGVALLAVPRMLSLSLSSSQQEWTIPDYFAGFNGYTPSEVGHATNGLFSVTSSTPSEIGVNAATGTYTVLGNSVLPVTVSATVRTVCAASIPPYTTAVYGNLLPEAVDLDVGAATGAPLGNLLVPFEVRLASNGVAVRDAQVRIAYAVGTIKITACVVNPAFGRVDCTFDQTPGVIVITAFTDDSGVPNPQTIVLATITANEVKTTGATAPVDVVATIVFLTTTTRVCSATSQCAVTAAAHTPALAHTGPVRRLLQTTAEPQKSRRLLQVASFVHGDTDGNGVFDINDIRYAIDYYLSSPKPVVTAAQARALIPVNDAVAFDWHRDVFFLFMVFVGKSRFVQDITAVSILNRVELSVRVFDKDNIAEIDEVYTKPIFFLDTTQSAMVFDCRTEYDVATQKLGVYPRHVGNGVYTAIADGSNTGSWVSQQVVGVALGMLRLNGEQLSTNDRRMSFFSITALGFASFETFRGVTVVNLLSSGLTTPAPVAATTTAVKIVTTTPVAGTTASVVTTTTAPSIVTTTPTPAVVGTVVPMFNQTVQSAYSNLAVPLLVNMGTNSNPFAAVSLPASSLSRSTPSQVVVVSVSASNTPPASLAPLTGQAVSLVVTLTIVSSAPATVAKAIAVNLTTFGNGTAEWFNGTAKQWQSVPNQVYVSGVGLVLQITPAMALASGNSISLVAVAKIAASTAVSPVVTTTPVSPVVTTTPMPYGVPLYNDTVQSNYSNVSLPLTVNLAVGGSSLVSLFIPAKTISTTVPGQTLSVVVTGSNNPADSLASLADRLASLVVTISIVSSAAVVVNSNVVVTLTTFITSVGSPLRRLLSLKPTNRRLLQLQAQVTPTGLWFNTSSAQWQTVQDQLYIPGL